LEVVAVLMWEDAAPGVTNRQIPHPKGLEWAVKQSVVTMSLVGVAEGPEGAVK